METAATGELILSDFVARMKAELVNNAVNKGDWRDWQPNQTLLESEVDHHLKKLKRAVSEGDRHKTSEYAADLANYMMKYHEIFGERQK